MQEQKPQERALLGRMNGDALAVPPNVEWPENAEVEARHLTDGNSGGVTSLASRSAPLERR